MKCSRCDENVNDSVKCALCSNHFGFCCAGITEIGHRRLGVERQASWRCLTCKSTASPSEPPSFQQPASLETIMDAICEMKRHLENIPNLIQDVKDIKQEITELRHSCQFNSDQLDEFKNRLAVVEEKVPEIGNLDNRVLCVDNEVSLLRDELAARDQWLRLNNVEVKGIPTKNNENLFAVLDEIGRAINYPVDKINVNYIARVPTHNSKEKSIIISFTNRYIKEDFIASARMKKTMSVKEVGFRDCEGRVFINDHLTPASKKLLTATKNALKPKGYQYIWVRYGKIHVRKDNNSKVFTINNYNDLNKLS